MHFYTGQHRYYCGVDLHARTMYLCVLDQEGGKILLHRNLRCEPGLFLEAVAPYRDGLVVATECMYSWYWLADLCARENIPFILGHALYMKAIHALRPCPHHLPPTEPARTHRTAPLQEQSSRYSRCRP